MDPRSLKMFSERGSIVTEFLNFCGVVAGDTGSEIAVSGTLLILLFAAFTCLVVGPRSVASREEFCKVFSYEIPGVMHRYDRAKQKRLVVSEDSVIQWLSFRSDAHFIQRSLIVV